LSAERPLLNRDRRAQLLALAGELRPELHRYCARLMGSVIDGEDVVQDTLVRAFVALQELEEQGLEETPPLRPWLFRIAHNRALDLLRGRAVRITEPIDAAADVVEVHTAAAARGVYAARNTHGVDVAALGLKFYPSHFAWNVNGEIAGKLVRMFALPITDDPGCISANICCDLVGLELAACILLRGGKRTGMNHIIDALLLSPSNDHRAHVDLDSQVFYGGKGTSDFLAPCTALAGDTCFLRQCQRRKQGQHASQPDELWRTFQMTHLNSILAILRDSSCSDNSSIKLFSIDLRQLGQHGAGLGSDVLALIFGGQRHQNPTHASVDLHRLNQPQRFGAHAGVRITHQRSQHRIPNINIVFHVGTQ